MSASTRLESPARSLPGSHFAPLAVWAALAAAQLGWLPGSRYAWGFDLTGYLPPPGAWLLFAASLALCAPALRSRVADAASRVAQQLAGGSQLAHALALVAICLGLWLLRERQIYGDSNILMLEAGRWRFSLPEPGASFLIGLPLRAARALGLSHEASVEAARGLVCVFGSAALLCLARAAGRLAPGRGAGVLALILCGGLLRVFAGHVEVYAFELAAACAYLWLALDHLEGRRSTAPASLALGLAIWMHLGALCLVPSWLWLLARPGAGAGERAARLRRGVVGGVLLLAPLLLFLGAWALAGGGEEFSRARGFVLQVLGRGSDPHAPHRWVRGWLSGPSRGTDYVWLSLPHLKYLANAAFLLVPPLVPLLAALALRRPRALVATPTARFLCAAGAPLLAYALLLRPIWGPFDWDLFCLPALFLAALAAHALDRVSSDAEWRDRVPWIAGFGLCFVGLPFLWMGFGSLRPAGPFVQGVFDWGLMDSGSRVVEKLAPWL